MRLAWSLTVAGCAAGAWATGSRTPSSMAAGAALLVPGVLLAMASVRALGRPATVVMHGPYRWVRHPYYLAMLLLLLGAIVALRAWAALILLVPAVRVTIERARREEHNLRLRFGEAYGRYARLVPFLLPLGPPLPRDSGSWVVDRAASRRPTEEEDRGSSFVDRGSSPLPAGPEERGPGSRIWDPGAPGPQESEGHR
jgi:hypothetical protein